MLFFIKIIYIICHCQCGLAKLGKCVCVYILEIRRQHIAAVLFTVCRGRPIYHKPLSPERGDPELYQKLQTLCWLGTLGIYNWPRKKATHIKRNRIIANFGLSPFCVFVCYLNKQIYTNAHTHKHIHEMHLCKWIKKTFRKIVENWIKWIKFNRIFVIIKYRYK